MTKYHLSWHLNPVFIPADPEERMNLWMELLKKVKADINAGYMLDWGIAVDQSEGYAIMESDEMGVLAHAGGYQPYIFGEIKPVLTADQTEEVMKRMAAAAKKKS
jgi:hypothetical protein